MKGVVFEAGNKAKIEARILKLINESSDFLSERTANSTRAVGDAIQELVADNFKDILGPELCREYSSSFARRAMADLAFTDPAGFYYVVDVKTHRLDTKFNMPNLISVERLARFYEDDKNTFALLKIAYNLSGKAIAVDKVLFVPIEHLKWSCLTIGALGWGQIQIANSNNIEIDDSYSRKKWMIELCDALLEFYPKEIIKIGERSSYFEKVKEIWLKKPD